MDFTEKSVGNFALKILGVSMLVMFWPMNVQAEEAPVEASVEASVEAPVEVSAEAEAEAETVTEAEMVEAEATTEEAPTGAETAEAGPMLVDKAVEAAQATAEFIEGTIQLGEFRITYYCCERYKHICGKGTGITASGRPVEAGHSIAVDPDIIPLGSRVWIDFGDGEGWHEYSADDTGGLVEDNHIDIAVETHQEALHQSKLVAQVCFLPPPSENIPV